MRTISKVLEFEKLDRLLALSLCRLAKETLSGQQDPQSRILLRSDHRLTRVDYVLFAADLRLCDLRAVLRDAERQARVDSAVN